MKQVMTIALATCLLLAACVSDDLGTASKPASPEAGTVGADAAADSNIDSGDSAAPCVIYDSVKSCGKTCAVCKPSMGRDVSTCDGIGCVTVCRDNAAKCSDLSCAQIVFDFSSTMLDEIQLLTPAALKPSVRGMNGNPAFAVDVSMLETNEVKILVPFCLSGTLDLRDKNLSARVLLESAVAAPDEAYYVSAEGVMSPVAPNIKANTWFTYTNPFGPSVAPLSSIRLKVGSLGAPFTGTVWIDDIRVF